MNSNDKALRYFHVLSGLGIFLLGFTIILSVPLGPAWNFLGVIPAILLVWSTLKVERLLEGRARPPKTYYLSDRVVTNLFERQWFHVAGTLKVLAFSLLGVFIFGCLDVRAGHEPVDQTFDYGWCTGTVLGAFYVLGRLLWAIPETPGRSDT